MKRNWHSASRLFFILLIVVSLCACKPITQSENSRKDFSIITPSGAPALALLDYVDNEYVSIEIVDGGDALSSEFANGEMDAIIAPINLGVKLCESTGNYQLMAVISWGNLYLVSTEEKTSLKNVAAFGEAGVPGKIIDYISEKIPNSSFEFYSSVNEVSAALLSGKVEAAVLAEPILTMTQNKWSADHQDEPLVVRYDLQSLYKDKTGLSTYPQAALFVKKTRMQEDTEAFIGFVNGIKQSIANYNGSKEALKERLQSIDPTVLGLKDITLIEQAYSAMSLDYRPAVQCVKEINAFLSIFDMSLSENSYVQ